MKTYTAVFPLLQEHASDALSSILIIIFFVQRLTVASVISLCSLLYIVAQCVLAASP